MTEPRRLVAPDGTSTELSTGLISASHRAVDLRRSRIVNGVNLQPWHPYTRSALLPVTPGNAMPLDVEIFPVNALIKSGHRIRLSIGSSDFPHAAAPDKRDNLVVANCLPGTKRTVADERLRREVHGRHFDKSARALLLLEKRFNFRAHRRIGSAFLIEKRRAAFWLAFDRGFN